MRKFARLGIDFSTVLYANEIYKELEEKRKIEEAEEEEIRKAEEEARIRAEEAQRRAEELASKAGEERKIAEERARKAEDELRKAQEERNKAEEERRKAEAELRRIEQKARRSRKGTEGVWVEKAQRKEKERWRVEYEALKREDEIRGIAEEERKKAEETRRRAEEDELRRKREKYERELSQLRVLASTGTLILIFTHELQGLIESMEELSVNFASIIQKSPETEQEVYKDNLESFNNRTEMIKELGAFLGFTIGSESRLEKKEWVLLPIVKSVFNPFRWHLKEFGVEYFDDIPDNLRTPKMYRSELVSILHNLMSNAIKAVKGGLERRIEVKGFEEDDVIHIRFLDSGKGLDMSLREEVFEPFSSYSEPDLRFGAGTGLGLKIVRDLVRSYGGDVRFIDAPDNWKTCVEVTFPVR